jgi:preprotein translocase subunit YajC
MNLIPDAMAQTPQPTPPAPPSAPAAVPEAPTASAVVAPGGPVDPTAPPPPTVPEMFSQLVPIFVVMGIVYILVIRPRARREREQLSALRNVRRGDTVVTNGGIIGKVTKAIDDNDVEVEIAPNVRIRLARANITEVRAKGEPVKDTPPAKS